MFFERTIAVLACAAAAVLVYPMQGGCDFIRIRGSEVNLREGPGKTYPVVHTAKAGDELPLIREEGLWYRVSLGNGKTAYVFHQLAERNTGSPTVAPDFYTEAPPSPDQRAGKGAWKTILMLLAAAAGFAAWKRRELGAALHSRLLDISGSRRGRAFRYDDHPPEQDKWEI